MPIIHIFPERAASREVSEKALAKPVAHFNSGTLAGVR
jgi:hypothetical protein